MAESTAKVLPTCPGNGTGALVEFLAELGRECRRNDTAKQMFIFSYAVSLRGWNLIRSSVERFRTRSRGRLVTAYVGLDDWLTEPDALRAMSHDGLQVNVVTMWPHTYHPKVFALVSSNATVILAGSNNLTKRGLTSNYEFGVRIEIENARSQPFATWLEAIQNVANSLTDEALETYRVDYANARRIRRQSAPTTRQRLRQLTRRSSPALQRFARSIVEVMNRETGTQGTQIQMPMEVVRTFFGMSAGMSRTFNLNGTKVNDEGLKHVARLPGLNLLTLDGTRVTDRGLMHLRKASRLRRLDIKDTKTTQEGIAELQKALPGLCVVR